MENNKTKIISVTSIIALVLILVGSTYAYFVAQTGEGKSTDIEISANTVDTFSFAVGDTLKFTADQFTFTEGGTNATASTYAKAILTANNKTNSVTEHYYLYLKISNNTFGYSQDSAKPELLLQITDKSGNAITNLTGLEYKTVTNGAGTSISGFDVTTKDRLITILNNREITTTSTLEEQWNVTLTFVNYEFNQASNGGKSFSAKLIIQKEKILTLAEYVISQYTGTQGENGIYYHNSSLANGARDNSYRYAGASESVNNYICLGSTESLCPDDNLYRIIGVFGDQVKVIKDKLIGNMPWDSSGSNTWSISSLNTYLNETYLPSLGTLVEKIAMTTWKVGGNTFANISQVVPSEVYQNEITMPNENGTSPTGETEYVAKIGLMYVSDYAFAVDTAYWTKSLGYIIGNQADNWTSISNIKSGEWTITRMSEESTYAFFVNANLSYIKNGINIVEVDTNEPVVRPVFFFKSLVTYVSGDGTQNSPILIN